MERNEIFSGLSKVATQTKTIDKEMSADLELIAKRFTSSLTDDELDSFAENIDKQAAHQKEAKLINKGDVVVCVDNYSPLFKGRRYIVSISEIPGYIGVQEQTGEDVGIFAVNRFVLDNNEQ